MDFAIGQKGEPMSDLISRRSAIDAIMCEPTDAHYPSWYAERLEQLPTAQRWISCEERLPYAEYGESDTVLTTCGYRDVEDTSVRWIRLLYFNGGNWCYPTGETYEAKVYAWMPLPEPWKGEQND